MKKTLTLFLAIFFLSGLSAQYLVDFEEYNLSVDEFLNGSDGSGGFSSENVFFPNNYNPNWQSWTGWAISAMTDVQTPGPTNQYSCIAGHGAGDSKTYAVSFVFGSSGIKLPDGTNKMGNVQFNNSTYTYISMLEGDGYAKKFGGEDGDDPDFYLLTIKGWINGNPAGDSIDFYLADYRFEDNASDYIINEWTTVNLNALGTVDSVSFQLSSSDVGAFGMNTPAYFCLDELDYSVVTNANEQISSLNLELFPNPTSDNLSLKWKMPEGARVFVFDASGKMVLQQNIVQGQQVIDVKNLPSGLYTLKLQTSTGWNSCRFVKQ